MENTIIIFIFGVTIFINALQYLVIFDIILSWLTLAGINWRPQFLSDILDPTYRFVKKIIPTTFGPLDFTPVIIIFTLIFLNTLVLGFFPEVKDVVISMS